MERGAQVPISSPDLGSATIYFPAVPDPVLGGGAEAFGDGWFVVPLPEPVVFEPVEPDGGFDVPF